MTLRFAKTCYAVLAVALLTFATGCGEGLTDHGDEIHVHGMVISDAGTPVVTEDDGIITGSITVTAGDETPDYEFTFLDHDGDPITTGLSEFSLEVTVEDTGVAIFHSTADFEAHFEGLTVGSTTLTVSLVHTADGDDHFTSAPVTLTVS